MKTADKVDPVTLSEAARCASTEDHQPPSPQPSHPPTETLPKMAVPRYPAPTVPEAMVVREDMQPKDRNDTADLDESQFEPGSRRRVLKNLLGITSKREMDQLEGREQVRTLEDVAAFYDKDHRFTAADVCRIHQVWLGRIYSWAGRYRQANVKKDEFPFAGAMQIPRLMTDFEEGPLRRHTPCRPTSIDRLAAALAEVHVELVLIHPFRER